MFRSVLFLTLFLIITNNALSQIKAGEKAPDLNITHWIENVPANKSLKGKFLVVDFWATWCAPCLESVPHMNELVKANKKNKDLVFLAISDEKESKIRALLKRVRFSSTVVADITSKTFDDFQVKAIPFCVLIDDKMEVKWAGEAQLLNNDMIRKLTARKEITSPRNKLAPMPESNSQIYEALRSLYTDVFDDTLSKELFVMGPLMDEMYGSKREHKGPGIYREMVLGRNTRETVAQLLGVGATQVVLPSGMGDSYISYCYKSAVKTKDTDLLESILKELELKYTTKDSLQEMITLEVTDTSRLYADLPAPDETMSRMSTSDKDYIISSMNNNLEALVKIFQTRFKCMVVIKDADRYKKKINMTVRTGTLTQFYESMLFYGIKATKGEKMLKVYDFTHN